jgi:uncharacterized phiE125 gp8 family phage protein
VSLPTLTDLKAHVNVSSTADDGELTDMLDAAVDVVEGVIGPITSQTVTETHYGLCSDVLVLRRMPVADLLAVGYRAGATTTALLLTDYELDADTGLVRLASGGRFAGNYRVTYSVGRPSVPAAVRLAILIVAGHLFETQRRPGFTSDAPAGFGGADGIPDATNSVPMGFAIPSRAQELLAPYMLPAIA